MVVVVVLAGGPAQPNYSGIDMAWSQVMGRSPVIKDRAAKDSGAVDKAAVGGAAKDLSASGSTGGLGMFRQHEAHIWLQHMRKTFHKQSHGHPHRGLFTGEPTTIAADKITVKDIRTKIHKSCIIHQIWVTLPYRKAVKSPHRTLEDLKKFTEECKLIGSGKHPIVSLEPSHSTVSLSLLM